MRKLKNFEWFNLQTHHGPKYFCLLVGALSVVIWVSVHQFLSMYARDFQMANAVRLEQEVSYLRKAYLQANPGSLDADLQQVEQTLIRDFSQLAKWAQDLQEEGKRWNLLVQYRIVQTEGMASPIQGVASVPLEIQVRSQGTGNGYGDQLQFIKALISSGPKVHIQKVLMTGDGQKAMHLTIGLTVWMKAIESVKL